MEDEGVWYPYHAAIVYIMSSIIIIIIIVQFFITINNWPRCLLRTRGAVSAVSSVASLRSPVFPGAQHRVGFNVWVTRAKAYPVLWWERGWWPLELGVAERREEACVPCTVLLPRYSRRRLYRQVEPKGLIMALEWTERREIHILLPKSFVVKTKGLN